MSSGDDSLEELYVEVADEGGSIAGLGSYVMVSPKKKVSDLKLELHEYLGFPPEKQNLWLQLPDDFPLSTLLSITDANIQMKVSDDNGAARKTSASKAGSSSAGTAGSSKDTKGSAGDWVKNVSDKSAVSVKEGPPVEDVFTRIGRYAASNAPDDMLKFTQGLPKSQLLWALPALIAYNNATINKFLYEIVGTDDDLLHRVQLLTHKRPPFSHITVATLKDGVIQLCEDNAETFEKGQKHRWVGKHPISSKPVKAVKVDYVFSSLARPVILSYYSDGQATIPLPPRTICKTGEDIYNETAVQLLFRLFNEVWQAKLPKQYRPELFTFNEVPGGTNLGYVELLEGCADMEDIEREGFTAVQDPDQFIRTTCGCILGTYLLGIKDRHRENTLFHKPTNTAFPIDFGFMLGKKAPSINCYCVAMSPHFFKYIKKRKRWPEFATLFLAGFDVVRQEAHSAISLGKLVFRGVPDKDEEFVEMFLRKTFLMEKSAGSALSKMCKRLRHGAICIDTAHKINSHAKNKKFLDKHRDWALVKGIVKSAEEAKPQARPGRVRGHIGKARLSLPKEFPGLPADIAARLKAI